MAVDVSSVAYIAPVIVYLLVALVTGAVLFKIKILGDSKFVNVFVALFIATIFVSTAGVIDFVAKMVPWFAVLLIAVFLLFVLLSFIGRVDDFSKGIGVVGVILFALIVLISGYAVFSHFIISYIPGPYYGYGADPQALYFTDILFSPRVLGGILLLAASALVGWILTKK